MPPLRRRVHGERRQVTAISDSPKSIKRVLREALKHERQLFADIAKAHAAGKARRAEHYQMRYVTSFDARLVAADRARRSFPVDSRLPASAIMHIANKVSALRGSKEPVVLRLKEKKSDPWAVRPVMAFGPENRTLQYLVLECLRARVTPHPCQYASLHGRHAAVEAVRNAILSGFRHTVELDIQSFYNSINGEELGELLPLPPRILPMATAKHYNLWPGWLGDLETQMKEVKKLKEELATPGDDPDHHNHHDHPLHYVTDEYPAALDEAHGGFLAVGRLGIPQGSAASPLIAECLLKPAIEQIPDCGVVVNYADNFMLLGTSKEAVALMSQALRSALKGHPAGPFSVRDKTYKLGETSTFLGYRLTPMSTQVIVEPTPKNLRKFQTRFRWRRRQVLSAKLAKERNTLLNKGGQFVRSWSASFSLWEGSAAHREQHLALLRELS